MIELSHSRWEKLRQKLIDEYGQSIIISYVCKTKLGFTVRDHKGWIDNPSYAKDYAIYEQKQRQLTEFLKDRSSVSNFTDIDFFLNVEPKSGSYRNCICLDFYNEAQETWFRLKYL